MAKEEFIQLLHQGVDVWNKWKESCPDMRGVDLSEIQLDGLDLSGIDLSMVNLRGAKLTILRSIPDRSSPSSWISLRSTPRISGQDSFHLFQTSTP